MRTPEIITIASRKLRKDMTEAEKILWNYLRKDISGFRFLRQKPIYLFTENSGLDRYIISDFYCHSKKLVIEVDGNIHCKEEIYLLDREKELLLGNLGIRVLRLENNEIIDNIDKVINKIKKELS